MMTAPRPLRRPLRTIVGAALAATILAGAGIAQDANPAVKARQSFMQVMAFNLGTLGAMAQEKAPYDAAAAQIAADNLVALTKVNLAPMFPAGTDAMSLEGTRALPAIWDDMAGVGAKFTALGEAAAGMADAAGTDLAGLQAAMGPLGGACGGCHKKYREPQ